MSVFVSDFTDLANLVVVHDDAPNGSHSGTLAQAAIAFTQNPDGTPNHQFLQVACPVAGCGSVSTHPIGGGAQADLVQRLFVYKLMSSFTVPAPMQTFLQAHGFPANFPWAPPRGWAAAKALVKLYCQLMDGANRWRLETVNQGG